MNNLTERQYEIYKWIFEETCRKGYQPSLRDISWNFGRTSPAAACCHLRALSRKGYLIYEGNGAKNRAICFLKTPDGGPFLGLSPIRSEVER